MINIRVNSDAQNLRFSPLTATNSHKALAFLLAMSCLLSCEQPDFDVSLIPNEISVRANTLVFARLGVSLQCVSNALSTRRFSESTAEAWSREFGFRKEFLLRGTGRLLARETGYSRVVQENDDLRTLVKRQTSEPERYRSLYGPLPAAV